jgi:hypothetical protein
MKRSLAHLLPAVLAASTVVLVAGAAPAQAITACSVMTPCLPENQGFHSIFPMGNFAWFTGNVPGEGAVIGDNSAAGGLTATSGVLGVYEGADRGSGVLGYVNTSTADDVAGVFGFVRQQSTGTNAAGVRGEATTTNGAAGTGVLGLHRGLGIGVKGRSVGGTGVLGEHTAATGLQAGVQGITSSNDDLSSGVRGIADGNSALSVGVYGSSATGIGAVGIGSNVGVVGYNAVGGLAGVFSGNVHVTGTLTKGAGAFRIDHPLDPERKYLQHSFVESPDMKNVYDGVARTDRRGFVTVKLPGYFAALNRDFRYQLTIVGTRGWRARVVKEIAGNRFTIQSDEPQVKVSWQVTGIRKDRYANAHRIQPEIAKPAKEQGTYLAPALYGKPRSQAAFRLPIPTK